jgi:hypothetical protein
MQRRGILTRLLAIIGTILIWLPLAAPVVLGIVVLFRARRFRFDYLMPAEIFPVALLGGVLLIWASWRARSRRALIGWGLGLAVALLVGSQGLAVVTGLASGATGMDSPWFTVVLAGIIAFSLALVAVGIGGILLVRDLRGSPHPSP